MLKRIFSISLMVFLSGCTLENKSDIIYLYPSDKSQVVTVFSDYNSNERVIAVGEHTNVPDDNYILLDISKIREGGDALGVCWNKNNHKWEIVNNDARIKRIQLDTTKYVFRNEWFRDTRKIPNTSYYESANCFVVETNDYSNPKPKGNGVVRRN